MPARSLSISQQFIEQVRDAVATRGLTQGQLAAELGIARSSVVKFLSGQNVDRRIFVRCCAALDISWKTVSGKSSSRPANATTTSQKTTIHVEALVKKVRSKVNADIHDRCGTMRVLDMEQPIGLGSIYTNVNILEKLLGHRRLSLNNLHNANDLANFERFMLSQIHQRRVPGLEAVGKYNKLMILGKPGAGKTTFMKRIANLCNQGKLEGERVPVFLSLKELAEAKSQPNLETYIEQQWKHYGIEEDNATQIILTQGRALILLDGLDEVQASDHQRVLNDIKNFSQKFRSCQFVITCRIAAQEYIFEQFTEVEIADFDNHQIAAFATKWFHTKNDSKKAERFIQHLEKNAPIKELATNPLLLTLLCLVFGEAADFPANRAELYKEGLDVLLKKWDAKRNIERHQMYKKLSLKRKEDLLSQIAFHTFNRGEIFFKQSIIEREIIEYIQNLPGTKNDTEVLELDSAKVLASIEAQHGLLVERAKGIYSFSHLTFQEYFTARQITRPTSQLQKDLKKLTTHITENRYREVFFLTIGMLPEADEFLVLMKQEIDSLLFHDLQLQQFLDWVEQKSNSVDVSYEQAAVRAFYFNFVLARMLEPTRSRRLTDYDLASSINPSLDRTRTIGLEDALRLDFMLDRNFARARELVTLDLDLSFAVNRNNDLTSDLDFNLDLALTFSHATSSELAIELEELNTQLPNIKDDVNWKEWWQENGKDWLEKLRSVMIEHRNIGHNWQLTNKQQDTLQKYYDANKLLVDCLNSDCYVTKATRQEIEASLLLPMNKIDKHKA